MMKANFIAVDMGTTNTDLVWLDGGGMHMRKLENLRLPAAEQVRQCLNLVGDALSADVKIGVTGGHYRALPPVLEGFHLNKVDEMRALGLGGLAAADLEEGLVVSAGTGTAMVAARRTAAQHVTGSAVGGGTLLGLANLILGTADYDEIDALALAGDANAADIMVSEAVGGEVGKLPANANAVNLGKLIDRTDFTREDLAAGLARLVAQVIAVIAINAAEAAGLRDIILIGHTMDLVSIQKEIALVGEFYQRSFNMPEHPGFATARGVIDVMKRETHHEGLHRIDS
ncbi:MAG: hypothetical protein WCY93_02425 [Anaerolineaceae bacterium]